jgi:hypothetical protein
MTSTPPPSDAPFGADTDDAVSALLDGELTAFAADHDTTEADARTRLEAWPGFEDRRAALAGARAVVATPVPALDDVTRHRLVRAAVGARAEPAPTAHRARVWKVLGAAAAALVVVAGIALAIDATRDEGPGARDSASSAGPVAPDLHGDIGDVGDLSGPDALRALLTGTRAPSAARERAAASSGADRPTSDQAGATPPSADGQALSRRSAAPPIPPAECAAQLARKRPVTFVGTGTFRGAAVTVIGLTERGRVIAFVVPSNDCTDVLTSVSR